MNAERYQRFLKADEKYEKAREVADERHAYYEESLEDMMMTAQKIAEAYIAHYNHENVSLLELHELCAKYQRQKEVSDELIREWDEAAAVMYDAYRELEEVE